MDYIAKRDIPVLGIRKGKVFFNEDDPIFQDRTLFDEYIPEVYTLAINTPVAIRGSFKELGDRKSILNGRLKNTLIQIKEPMLGTVSKIEVVTAGVNRVTPEGVRAHYNILILGNNGLYYSVPSSTLDIRKLENTVEWAVGGARKATISPSKVYWFINSNGEIQSDIQTRNKKREEYLRKAGLCFKTYADARSTYDAIMAGRMSMREVE